MSSQVLLLVMKSSAQHNNQIFLEEQTDVFELQQQISFWRKQSQIRQIDRDQKGAQLRERLATIMSEELESLDEHCGECAFERRNAGRVTIHMIDLHCLQKHQALKRLEVEMNAEQGLAHSRVAAELHIVTGHGAHSKSGSSIIKKAVVDYLIESNKSFTISQKNKGLICVPIQSASNNTKIMNEPVKHERNFTNYEEYTEDDWQAWQADWDSDMYVEDFYRAQLFI